MTFQVGDLLVRKDSPDGLLYRVDDVDQDGDVLLTYTWDGKPISSEHFAMFFILAEPAASSKEYLELFL